MAKVLNIRDGDILNAYKEWVIQSAISINIWKAKYPDTWIDAGGETATFDGREYFGGKVAIESTTEEFDKEFLKLTGVDDEGVEDIEKTLNTDGVDHVFFELRPKTSYTHNQLTWFMREVLEPSMTGLTLTLSYPEPDAVETKRPATSSSVEGCPGTNGTEALVWSTSYGATSAINTAIATLFMITNIFEEHGTVEYETVGGETIATITVIDWNWLDTGEVVNDIYDIIWLGEPGEGFEDTPYRLICVYGGFGKTSTSANMAGDLWAITSPVYHDADDTNGGWADIEIGREYQDGLIIMKGGKYWIDIKMWKEEVPLTTLVLMGALLTVGVQEESQKWYEKIISFVVGFFEAVLHMVTTIVSVVLKPISDLLVDMGIVDQATADKWLETISTIVAMIIIAVVTAGVGAVIAGTAMTISSAISAIVANLGAFIVGDFALMASIGMEVYGAFTTDEFAVDKVDKDTTEVEKEGFTLTMGDEISGGDAIDMWFDTMGDSEATMAIF